MTEQQQAAMRQALEALELAQDNLRPHGDNCFLHDDGEYNRCFCGKDSLSNHLQSVIESLDTTLRQALEQQQMPEPFGYFKAEPFGWTDCDEDDEGAVALYEYPKSAAQWVGLSEDEVATLMMEAWGCSSIAPRSAPRFARAIEAKLRNKNGY